MRPSSSGIQCFCFSFKLIISRDDIVARCLSALSSAFAAFRLVIEDGSNQFAFVIQIIFHATGQLGCVFCAARNLRTQLGASQYVSGCNLPVRLVSWSVVHMRWLHFFVVVRVLNLDLRAYRFPFVNTVLECVLMPLQPL